MDINWYQVIGFIIMMWLTSCCIGAIGAAFGFIIVGPRRIYKAIKSISILREITCDSIEKQIAINKYNAEVQKAMINRMKILNAQIETYNLNIQKLKSINKQYFEENNIDNKLESENIIEREVEEVIDNTVDLNKEREIREKNEKLKDEIGYGKEEYDFIHERLTENDEPFIEKKNNRFNSVVNKENKKPKIIDTSRYMNIINNSIENCNLDTNEYYEEALNQIKKSQNIAEKEEEKAQINNLLYPHEIKDKWENDYTNYFESLNNYNEKLADEIKYEKIEK